MNARFAIENDSTDAIRQVASSAPLQTRSCTSSVFRHTRLAELALADDSAT